MRWAAYQGEIVVLSGAKLLRPQWKPYKGGVLVAAVAPEDVTSEAERAYLADEALRGPSGYQYAPAKPFAFSCASEAAACDASLWENGTDFAGNDLRGHNKKTGSAAECCALCTQQGACCAAATGLVGSLAAGSPPGGGMAPGLAHPQLTNSQSCASTGQFRCRPLKWPAREASWSSSKLSFSSWELCPTPPP